MAADHFTIILLLLSLLQFPAPSISFPLCTNSRPPFTPTAPLAFCSYNATSCCDSAQDLSLRRQFEGMNISASASASGCASLVKSILCSRCDPFSADLFQVNSAPRSVPLLCNSTIVANSSQNSHDFCAQVWDTCQNASLVNSPFAAPLRGQAGTQVNSTSTKLTDIWQARTDFCTAFGGDNSICFDGKPVVLNSTETPNTPSGMCLEKIGNDSYLNMVALPDGSNRAFFSNQRGQIWLATIPEQGSGGTLELDESNPFLDLTDEVHFDTEFGLMGIAVHPNFAQNGRFFASFNCDKSKWPGCGGRCACNSDVNCDPSKLGPDNGADPCQYQSVIAEYSANGTAPASRTSVPASARPVEVRRIFTMGLPFTSHHAGQILFGPTDGYLYFMMGDGGGSDDPYNFAQNKKSLLGKIMRLDIDNIPSDADVSRLGLWGKYSIPRDNPFAEDEDLQPEIWATGFRNPWRCSFDSARPSYFMCADVGQDHYEEVDLITKDGNYGWSVYEGDNLFTPKQSPGGNTSLNSIRPIFPVMGYNHSDINKKEGSASITGGYFYRSMTDPCLYGSYLYGDLYASAIWAGIETPENSGNFNSSQIPFSCARDSPVQCSDVPGSSLPALGYVFSFGEDNNKDIFVLASSGVYRVVRPSRCNYSCTRENATAIASPGPASSPPSSATFLRGEFKSLVLLLSSIWLLLLGLL